MSTNHRHSPKTSTTRPWTCCVRPERCSGAAHGNVQSSFASLMVPPCHFVARLSRCTHVVTVVDTCRCGAERHTELNGRHIVYGPWVRQ